MAELVTALGTLLLNTFNQNPNRSSIAKADVETALTICRRMKAYLTDYSSEQIDEGRLQNHAKEIQDAVYDIEDALGKFMVKVPHHIHSNRFSWKMHDLKHSPSEMKASRKLSRRLKKIEHGVSALALPALDSLVQPFPNTRLEEDYNNLAYHQVVEDDGIVGFEVATKKLIQQLKGGENIKPRPLKISIVGPVGSGKTILVKSVYESRRVQGFFNCHAFIEVPRRFESRTLLLKVLSKFESQIIQEPVAHHNHPDDEEMKLRKIMEQNRYVVILDNVWREQDLNCFVNALPNCFPGSKIIITTCDSILASSHATSSEYIHDLSKGLSAEEAYKLFCKKAFRGDCSNCPVELEELAQIIIKRCDGLPLAISAAGTFLAQKPRTLVEWEKFNKSLGSNLQISQVWEPSYRDLHFCVKSCFLYFSMFPEDTSIKRERLIRLWVAEGFVMPGKNFTKEEVADGYLNELIRRNLVHVSSKEIDGQVRSCGVLNLVREFIMSKAENFVTVLESNSTSTSTNSGEKIRRLSLHYVPINNFSRGGRYSLNKTRTLLVFGQHELLSQNYELEKVLKTLENLRVLDLKGVSLDDFPKSIVGLTLLTYISMRKTKIKSVPSSIKKLTLLETLDLKRTQVTKLPKEIYELKNMRHLLVSHGCDHDDGPVGGVEVPVAVGNVGALSELQKLSLIKVGNNRTILKALSELIGLRKLGLTDVKAEHATELCCAIEKMKHLSTLEVRSTGEEEYLDMGHMMKSPPRFLQRFCMKGPLISLPQWISELHSAVKIGLKRSKLNADANPLEPLQALPNLMELDLVDYYTGKELEFKLGTFKKLKILRIEQFDQLEMIAVENGAMPELKKLTISKCKNLTLFPLGVEDLKKLEELFLHDMHSDLIDKLQRDGYESQAVQHIPVIHSFNSGSNQSSSAGFHNLSRL